MQLRRFLGRSPGLVESHELKLATGEPIDVGAYTQGINSMLGVYRLLGLERRQKPKQLPPRQVLVNGHTTRCYLEEAAGDAPPEVDLS